ncbi:MAG: branched-chain amino acid ABC transporter permease [Butyrivibrio sp.]
MDFFIAQLINGLKMGSIYALVAIGYSMVYGILRLVNFAHGDLMMIATYGAWMFISWDLPIGVSLGGAILITVVFAVVIERLAYRPLRKGGSETTLMVSLAVSTLLQNIATLIFSPQNQAFKLPEFFSKTYAIRGVQISMMNIITFAVTIVLLIIISLVIKHTRAGMAMRACSDNMAAAQLMGINVNNIIVFAFVIGGILAATAGIMYSGSYVSFSPDMGFMIGIKAFVAAVIGGIGSFGGAALGGLVLGLLEMFFAGYLPSSVTSYRTACVFLILIIVLLVKPNGLFGKSDEKRS